MLSTFFCGLQRCQLPLRNGIVISWPILSLPMTCISGPPAASITVASSTTTVPVSLAQSRKIVCIQVLPCYGFFGYTLDLELI